MTLHWHWLGARTTSMPLPVVSPVCQETSRATRLTLAGKCGDVGSYATGKVYDEEMPSVQQIGGLPRLPAITAQVSRGANSLWTCS